MKPKVFARFGRFKFPKRENQGAFDRIVRRGFPLAAALVFLGFAACLAASKTQKDSEADKGIALVGNPISEYSIPAFPFKKPDRETSQDNPTASVTLLGTGAQISGEGATFASGVLTIDQGGLYVISGSLADGQIRIDAGKKENVRIVLDGVSLTNRKGAPIYAKSAKKLVITLVGDNFVADGGSGFKYEDAKNEEPNAAIYSVCDLSFNGNGSLEVNATFANAIQTKDVLCFISGNYDINAAGNGLVGKDGIAFESGNYRIRAGSEGLRSKGNGDPERGYVIAGGGIFDITAGSHAVKADTAIALFGVTLDARTMPGSTQKSPKGLNGDYIYLSEVNMTFNMADDAMNAVDVEIESGTIVITCGDDAIHADGILNVFGGDITVLSCHEGLEGKTVNISGGKIVVHALEDGINASQSKSMAPLGTKVLAPESCGITISGGDVTVIALSDGLDSNGYIKITGGNCAIFSLEGGLTVNALHSKEETVVSGGTLVFGGTNPGRFSASSSQGYVFLPSSVKKGDTVKVSDGSSMIFEFVSPSDAMRLVVSTPKIVANKRYSVAVGDRKSDVMAGSSLEK